ncbi:667_t:CDS:1, partial [Racocetra fulgida]
RQKITNSRANSRNITTSSPLYLRDTISLSISTKGNRKTFPSRRNKINSRVNSLNITTSSSHYLSDITTSSPLYLSDTT